MNNRGAYFNFKMKLPRVQAMNINSNIPFVFSAKLTKFAKYFYCGTEIWDKIITSKWWILSALNIKLYKNKIIFETWVQICPNLEFWVQF